MTNTALVQGSGNLSLTIPASNPVVYVGAQVYMTSAAFAALSGFSAGDQIYMFTDPSFNEDGMQLTDDGSIEGFNDYLAAPGTFTPDGWRQFEMLWDTTAASVLMCFDGVTGADTLGPFVAQDVAEIDVGMLGGTFLAGIEAYIGNVWVGTTPGASDILLEDWSSGDFSNWTTTNSSAIVTSQPSDPPAFVPLISGSPPPPAGGGRVFIAWDDGPLEPNPTWTSIDQAANGFPAQFVSGYDIKVGRQTLLSQTDTGTATVYCNDREGLFDDRNMSSPYQGKLSGRQIMLQLFDPVTEVWEPQFRGLIDDYSYDIDGSASDANGDPINASIQIQCVDMFDYLNGFGLTPGLAGVTPPAGAEDGVYYAATAGTLDDRIIEILTDAGIDPDMYGSPGLASGNVKLIGAKYDPGESALTAIRDAVDAEFPFIGINYCDRHGKFQFRGRYGRFDPDAVSSEPGSDWDFTRWGVGDQTAIIADPARAQMRVLSFARSRAELINVAMSWTQNLPAAEMPNQVFADTSSIAAYGQHSAPPMSDLLTADYAGPGTITPSDGKTQCFLYAKLLVKNKAFPREAITSLQVKAISPEDDRATETWAFITRSDISHIVNCRVGYPGGTGFTGDSPADDYYIEGRQLVVRPLNPTHDYVEYNVEVTPAVWSMDTHGVFPSIDGSFSPPEAGLVADFNYAQ